MTFPRGQHSLEESGLHCVWTTRPSPSLSPPARDPTGYLVSLAHTAWSVPFHSSRFTRQAVEQPDCFTGTAKRGAPTPVPWPGALVEGEDLWCTETGHVLRDFRHFKGRGGARNNKKENDKHSASGLAEMKSLSSHSEQSEGLILRGPWPGATALHNVPRSDY